MKRVLKYMFGISLILALGYGLAWAQATAQVSGTVTDQSGARLPGAEVTATQTETGLVRSVISNETGSYALPRSVEFKADICSGWRDIGYGAGESETACSVCYMRSYQPIQ